MLIAQPVRAGETVALWASGLGPSDPAAPVGAALASPLPLVHTPEVNVAGRAALVVYAGLAYAGVWQVNIRLPEGIPPGMATVDLRVGNAVSQGMDTLEIAP